MAPKAAMTLATGKQQSGKPSVTRAGFSLIEIILVLGLMALAAGLVITNFVSLADRGDSQTSEEALQAAVRYARFVAASERTITELRFDKENGNLTVSTADSESETFALDNSFEKSGPSMINFYLVPPAEGLAPQVDANRTRLETTVVRFAPDRSSSPFVAEIDTGTGTSTRMIFDPFSSLLITPE